MHDKRCLRLNISRKVAILVSENNTISRGNQSISLSKLRPAISKVLISNCFEEKGKNVFFNVEEIR